MPAIGLLVGDRADHVQGGKIRHQVCGSGREPPAQPCAMPANPAQIFGEAADHNSEKANTADSKRGREGREQQRQRADNQELQHDEIQRDQDPGIRRVEIVRET